MTPQSPAASAQFYQDGFGMEILGRGPPEYAPGAVAAGLDVLLERRNLPGFANESEFRGWIFRLLSMRR